MHVRHWSLNGGPPAPDAVNILLVDDQPAKLLTYEAILSELGEKLIKATRRARRWRRC